MLRGVVGLVFVGLQLGLLACEVPPAPPSTFTPTTNPPPVTPPPETDPEEDPPLDPPDSPTGPTGPSALTGDPFAAVPAPDVLPPTAISAIKSAIDSAVSSVTATSAVYIVDAENGQEIYVRAPDLPLKPASNTKLFTTATAFDLLGADHQMEARIYADKTPTAAGAVSQLTIISEHDFTWSTMLYATTSFPAERIADRVVAAGVKSVTTLSVAGDYIVQGESTGTYDADGDRQLAADLLASTLEGRGITIGATTVTDSFAPPKNAVSLAKRTSLPIASAAHPLNVYSHNEFADLLARHNGYLLRNGSTYEEGAAAAKDWLASTGVDASGFQLHDGSGLSHSNRVTARQVVGILAYMATRPSGLAWQRTFSIGNVIGTLESRMSDPDVSGRFYGKTGTLNGVICTSGVLFHKHDGHRYFVSILMNDVADASAARSAEDAIVAAVAHDRRSLGTRPAKPTLRMMRSGGNGRIHFAWDPVKDADAYDLWLSKDAAVWERAGARRVTQTTHVAAGLDASTTYYARLVASNAAGDSEPSNVLAASTRKGKPKLLLVEAFDRYATQPENPLGRGHDFLAGYARAFGERTFDSVGHDAVAAGAVKLSDYSAVFWQLGEESTADETFTADEETIVSDAIARGVHFFVSGSELAWDLDNKGTTADRAFAHDVLHVSYVADSAGTKTATAMSGMFNGGASELPFYTPGTQDVAYPDKLSAGAGATAELAYVGGQGGVAAVSYSGAAKVVVFGFPFETLATTDLRQSVMAGVLAFMGQ